MKLRVKLQPQGGNGEVYRVELPPGATAAQLQQALRQVLPPAAVPSAQPLTLSLNKKTPLPEAGDGATVASLGVCSGDTVWVLNSPAPEAPTSVPTLPSPPACQRQDVAEGASSADKRLKTSSAPVPVSAPPQHDAAMAVDDFYARVGSPSQGAIDTEADMEAHLATAMEHDEQAQPAQPAAPPAPDHLLRALGACKHAGCGASPHQLLTLAVHAALLETGFLAPDGADATSYAADICKPGSGSLWSASYALPPVAAAAAGGAAGTHVQLPPVRLACAVMGPYLVVHGTVAGSRTASGSARLHISEHVAPGMLQRWQQQGQQALALEPQAYAALPALWAQVKDGVCVPLLCRSYAEAGLAPPLGLLTLPAELKEAVLRLLGPRDLAAVASSCSALRHLASEDQLWQPLFEREFANASAADKQLGLRRGWKHALAVKWTERKSRAAAAAAAGRNSLLPRQPPLRIPAPPGPMPWGPVPTLPLMPSGLVGGDYDRLPAPMLGAGPGVYRLGGARGEIFPPMGPMGPMGPGPSGLPGMPGPGGRGGLLPPGSGPGGPFQSGAFRTRGGHLGFP